MKLTRLLTAVIGFPIVAIILILGNSLLVNLFIFVVALICLYEIFNAYKIENKLLRVIGYIAAIPIIFLDKIFAGAITDSVFLLLMYVPTLITILFCAVVFTGMKITLKEIITTLFSILYIVFFIMFIPMIRLLENGHIYLWYILIISWGTDIFAFLIGRGFGKHHFSKISPKKTIEGTIAGTTGALIASIIFTVIINNVFTLNIPYLPTVILSVLLSLLSQVGDFAASSIKREMKIKDYGTIIPGHGGMLDRIDSLIFIAPAIFAIVYYFV